MFEHVMLDLETLGTAPGSAILSIGAVRFDLEKLELGDEFYAKIDIKSSVDAGLGIDIDTLLWWLKKPELFEETLTGGELIAKVFWNYTNFITTTPDTKLWSYGANFDGVLLREAFRRLELEYPTSYRNDMCLRTMRQMFNPEGGWAEGTKHNALDDARGQAKFLIEIVKGVHV